MELHEKLTLAKSLMAKRDEIDAKLEALFNGGSAKSERLCGLCKKPGHNAATCPEKEAAITATPDVQPLSSPVL